MQISWLWYELCGIWVVVVHAGAGVFAVVVSVVYITVLRTPVLSYTITQVKTDILDYFDATITLAVVIAAGHVLLAGRILLRGTLERTVRGRRVAAMPSRRLAVAPASFRRAQATVDRLSSWSARRIGRGKRDSRLHRWWTWHTPEITRIRMISEVALQIYQANKISQLVASVAINRVMTTVIVLNCWLSPTVHYVMQNHSGIATRLVRLVLDACLDIVYSIAIPTAIIYPYYQAYTGELDLFDVTLFYMDSWYTNALSEMRQVFVTSWFDLISKAIGSLALLYRLYVVQAALTTAREMLVPKTESLPDLPRLTGRLCKLLDAMLVITGTVVLALHVHASAIGRTPHESDLGCLLEMHPWGATGYTCACLEISCSQHGILGDHAHIKSLLERVDPHSLQVLILSNCPELQVPSTIQHFENVMMIKVYNSTIVSWDHEASLRQSFHPFLQVLYMARVNMSHLPDGLLAPDFPANLWDVEFCLTNLTTFPETISSAWQSVLFVLLEGNPAMTEIPSALLQLPYLDSLFVSSNGIQSVADDVLANLALISGLSTTILSTRCLQRWEVLKGSTLSVYAAQTSALYLRSGWLQAGLNSPSSL